MKRIFFAIEIPEIVREIICDYIGELRSEFKDLKVGWEKKEKIHLTLKFLGETPFEKIGLIKKSARKVSVQFSDFDLTVAGTGIFPNLKRPRILWLGLKEEGKMLENLFRELDGKLGHLGLKRDKRKFKPHLTIARLREPYRSINLARTHLQKKFEPVGFRVNELALVESHLNPTGSVFEILEKFELKS